MLQTIGLSTEVISNKSNGSVLEARSTKSNLSEVLVLVYWLTKFPGFATLMASLQASHFQGF